MRAVAWFLNAFSVRLDCGGTLLDMCEELKGKTGDAQTMFSICMEAVGKAVSSIEHVEELVPRY